MNEQKSVFWTAMMTGLFVGIIDTVICLFFNIFYRSYTGYFPSELINVSSLIFMINLIQLIIGIIYFLFRKAFKKGDAVYPAAILLLTAFLAWKGSNANYFDDAHVNHGFHGLLCSIILILGLSAACVPMLFHNRKFLENVI